MANATRATTITSMMPKSLSIQLAFITDHAAIATVTARVAACASTNATATTDPSTAGTAHDIAIIGHCSSHA